MAHSQKGRSKRRRRRFRFRASSGPLDHEQAHAFLADDRVVIFAGFKRCVFEPGQEDGLGLGVR